MIFKNHSYYQRITAILIAVFFSISISLFVLDNTIIFFDFIRYSFLIFCFIGLWHGLLGVQTICEDYIKNLSIRRLVLIIIKAITYSVLAIGLYKICF